MNNLSERKKIILEIVLDWMGKRAKMKPRHQSMFFKWGRKGFKIKRVY